MTDDRLPSALEAAALRRRVESDGGTATILHRGDADRGSLVLIVMHKGEERAIAERMLDPYGRYRWASRPAQAGQGSTLIESAMKRVRVDPDLWLIELDIPDPERFIAQLAGEC
ncbi:MAG TPA: DUF1491 family protein [Sphingomicrobium sp.]|jgi:hypothetical protein|nr:DUF1491 family protein [Sphingomicrobium sp.]